MIEVKNLTKLYGSKKALDDVSFTAEDGEILGLLGLNGAGKSTTMNIITGYLSATSGHVKIGDFDMGEEPMKAKAQIGYLPEQPPLYVDMRVDEYLDFVCSLKKVKQNKKQHIEEVCGKAGLLHVKRRIIKNLSKGYKQRVGLAQALIGDPSVIILDEPTVGLDPSQIIEIRSLIKELGKTKTIIVSSHILPEVKEVCHKVVVLHQGKMIASDTPENLSRRVASPHRVTAWIKGSMNQVEAALKELPFPVQVSCGEEKEPEVFEYKVEAEEGRDIRSQVFYAMAEASLPMLAIKGADVSMEDIFLSLIGRTSECDGDEDRGSQRENEEGGSAEKSGAENSSTEKAALKTALREEGGAEE